MNISLDKKVALVTGGATGIGKGIAKALSDSGAIVIITSRDNRNIRNTLKILSKKCLGYNLDVSKSNNIEILYKRIKKSGHFSQQHRAYFKYQRSICKN